MTRDQRNSGLKVFAGISAPVEAAEKFGVVGVVLSELIFKNDDAAGCIEGGDIQRDRGGGNRGRAQSEQRLSAAVESVYGHRRSRAGVKLPPEGSAEDDRADG